MNITHPEYEGVYRLPPPDPMVSGKGLPAGRTRLGKVLQLEFISRWRWWIAGLAVSGFLLGYAFGLLQVPLYEARLALEIESLNSEFLNMKQVQPLDEGGVTNPFSDIQTQIKILQSSKLHHEVVERMSRKIEAFRFPPRARWFRVPPWLVRISPKDVLRKEATRTSESLEVRALGQTRIIEVTARSTDPKFASEFLNELNTAYAEQNMRARWEMGQRTSEALQRVLEESRLKLRDSESALQSYALDADLVFLSQNSNVADQKLSELQDELSKAEENRIIAQSNLEMADLALNDDLSELPDSIDQAGIREDRAKLVELRRQRAELAALYTPNYVGIQRLDAQTASVEASLQAERQNVRAQLKNDFIAARRRETLIRAGYDRQMQMVTNLAKRSVQFNMLQREVQGDRQVYDEVLKQVKDASIATAMGASNIRTVDPAVPPNSSKGPGPLLDAVLGLFSFSAIGVLIAQIRDAAHATFHDPGDVFTSTGLVELGFIPHNERSIPLCSSVSVISSLAGSVPAGPSLFPRPVRPLLPGANSPGDTAMVEAYRNVVVSLLSESGLFRPRVVAITSALSGEGKTTVVANLGAICAAAGKRVALIDADLIRGGLSMLLRVEGKPGLADLLENSGISTASDYELTEFIRPTGINGLSILPRGDPHHNARNRLHFPVLGHILHRIGTHYETVLIDTPSVLPLADARLIAQFCDGVVVVVRSGRAMLEALTLTRGRLEMSGARIIGTVLNDWNPARSVKWHYAEYCGGDSGATSTVGEAHDVQFRHNQWG